MEKIQIYVFIFYFNSLVLLENDYLSFSSI